MAQHIMINKLILPLIGSFINGMTLQYIVIPDQKIISNTCKSYYNNISISIHMKVTYQYFHIKTFYRHRHHISIDVRIEILRIYFPTYFTN